MHATSADNPERTRIVPTQSRPPHFTHSPISPQPPRPTLPIRGPTMSTLTSTNAMRYLTLTLLATLVVGCAQPQPQYETIGSVERLDPRLDKLISKDAQIEKLAEGFEWSEGPVYIEKGNYLLFSDVPKNVIYKWDDVQGNTEVSEYLKPSGYTGKTPRKGEMGSNGLTLDNDGRLTICQHGDRRVVRV